MEFRQFFTGTAIPETSELFGSLVKVFLVQLDLPPDFYESNENFYISKRFFRNWLDILDPASDFFSPKRLFEVASNLSKAGQNTARFFRMKQVVVELEIKKTYENLSDENKHLLAEWLTGDKLNQELFGLDLIVNP